MILPNKKGDFIMDCSIFDRVYAGMLKSVSEFQTGNQDEISNRKSGRNNRISF